MKTAAHNVAVSEMNLDVQSSSAWQRIIHDISYFSGWVVQGDGRHHLVYVFEQIRNKLPGSRVGKGLVAVRRIGNRVGMPFMRG